MEMGLQIGDEMTINVLGRDIVGTIANFREVTWEDAGIGCVVAERGRFAWCASLMD